MRKLSWVLFWLSVTVWVVYTFMCVYTAIDGYNDALAKKAAGEGAAGLGLGIGAMFIIVIGMFVYGALTIINLLSCVFYRTSSNYVFNKHMVFRIVYVFVPGATFGLVYLMYQMLLGKINS